MKVKSTGTLATIALAVMGTLALVSVRSFAVELAYPFERAYHGFRTVVWNRVAGAFQASSANAENFRLRRRVAELEIANADIARLKSENARLRSALNFVERASESWMAASILSRNGGAAGVSDSFRVDKGSLAGVQEGSVVIAPAGLVGVVSRITPHTSEILLLTDRSVKVACEAELGARGILSGGDAEYLSFDHAKGAEVIRPGMKLFTSGSGGVFPKGVPVGTLQGVRRDANGLVCGGEVLPAVDFSALEDVFIRREK